jgi:hypothetical protein
MANDPTYVGTKNEPVLPMGGPPPARPDAPVEPELSPQDRLEALLLHVRSQANSGAPVSPYILKELDSIVTAGRGDKGSIIRHDFPRQTITGAVDKVVVFHSVEEALDYARALPPEVRERPHWKAAELAMLNAMDSGDAAAVGRAQTAFENALAEDRKLTPLERKPDELLPDGRIRDDRFPDRRLAVPVEPAPAA